MLESERGRPATLRVVPPSHGLRQQTTRRAINHTRGNKPQAVWSSGEGAQNLGTQDEAEAGKRLPKPLVSENTTREHHGQLPPSTPQPPEIPFWDIAAVPHMERGPLRSCWRNPALLPPARSSPSSRRGARRPSPGRPDPISGTRAQRQGPQGVSYWKRTAEFCWGWGFSSFGSLAARPPCCSMGAARKLGTQIWNWDL